MKTKTLHPMVLCATFAFALAIGLFVANSSIFINRAMASSGPKKLHVIEHSTNDKVVDIGPVGDSLGDLDAFANPIYDAANKTKVGHDGGNCVRTVVGQAYECNWTFFLKGGQISVEGPYYDHADSVLAVIGGTGRYSKVRGEMKLHARGNPVGSEYNCVFYLS